MFMAMKHNPIAMFAVPKQIQNLLTIYHVIIITKIVFGELLRVVMTNQHIQRARPIRSKWPIDFRESGVRYPSVILFTFHTMVSARIYKQDAHFPAPINGKVSRPKLIANCKSVARESRSQMFDKF